MLYSASVICCFNTIFAVKKENSKQKYKIFTSSININDSCKTNSINLALSTVAH